METKDELKRKAAMIKPLMWIGKSGISQGTITELNKLLKKKKLVKVKFLRNFIEEHDKKESIALLSKETQSEIISMVGFTVALYRK